MTNMQVLVWLLLPLLPLCPQARARSLPTQAVRMKHKVHSMAEQLVTKLERFRIPPSMAVGLEEQQYNYTVCYVLQFLNKSSGLILDSFKGSRDVRSELASLSGFVDQSRQCPCSSAKLTPPEALAGLHAKSLFPDSVIRIVYYRLKEYLKYLQGNLDKLETCS